MKDIFRKKVQPTEAREKPTEDEIFGNIPDDMKDMRNIIIKRRLIGIEKRVKVLEDMWDPERIRIISELRDNK